MAYNEYLADRIRRVLQEKHVSFIEKEMMGGITFMVNEKMCLGIVKENLMARIDPLIYDEALTRTGCREMDFTKRPMRGFVFIDSTGTDMDDDLEYWIDLALEYNPIAKSRLKKGKSGV